MRFVDGSKTGVVLAGIILVSLACVSAKAASFQGLGDLPGGDFVSSARGVSGDGLVVVGFSHSGSSFWFEAFRWTETGGMVGLGYLPGGVLISEAHGVSADGSVVAGNSSSASGGEAFRWTDLNGNGLVDPNEKLDYHPEFGLGDLPGGRFDSISFDVSADGSVVVGDGYTASGREAFRWTEASGMVGLGDLPGGGFDSYARGVLGDGKVVVGSSDSTSGSEAFRWTEASGMVRLGDLPGGSFRSWAGKGSADGSVIVGRSDSDSGYEAFRWTEVGGMVGLGHLPGGGFDSGASDISADGSVIVGRSDSDSGYEAFIWDAANGMRSLKDVLENDFGLDLSGWTLESARGISDDGSTIVGDGDNPSGYYEAWIATVCWYELVGDNNDDCRVDFKDFAELGAGWQISYDMDDLKEMADNWLINCNVTPADPACIPK